MAGREDTSRGPIRPYPYVAAMRSLGIAQAVTIVVLTGVLVVGIATNANLVGLTIVATAHGLFVLAAIWRVVLIQQSAQPERDYPAPVVLPRYTILVALLDEANVLPQLVQRLSAIDYPADRLQGFLLLEAHDHPTRAAAFATPFPDWLEVLVVPPGGIRTKPAALNLGLAVATGDLVTVYDAEDDPDPLQLREAAARFADDATGRLATLQAPLRIRRHALSQTPFLDRQFAIEYASLFDVTLPALARMGLPFPLGGTSNHFRASALRDVGGWDAHNVTEDADLGFRLWRSGYRLGTLRRPTYETPPGPLVDWLPQRTRWLKGFMQTWGVHTRSLKGLGLRGMLALIVTLGLSLAAASVHAATLAWISATILIALAASQVPDLPVPALVVLAAGSAAACLSGWIGANRAGVPFGVRDVSSAPLYWCLLSLAFFHAVWRLVREPFTWDKTPHVADPAVDIAALAELDAGREPA